MCVRLLDVVLYIVVLFAVDNYFKLCRNFRVELNGNKVSSDVFNRLIQVHLLFVQVIAELFFGGSGNFFRGNGPECPAVRTGLDRQRHGFVREFPGKFFCAG